MNKKILIPSIIILTLGVVVYYFMNKQQHPIQIIQDKNKTSEAILPETHKPELSMACSRVYKKITAKKLDTTSDIRFINKHFEYEGEVYRTRFFYDDSEEGDIPTYLVYKEDNDSFPIIIETSKYKPGKKFNFFTNNINNYLYTESGINQLLDSENEVFTHYENERLIEVISTNLNCKFNN